MSETLRIAVVLATEAIPRWQQLLVEHLQAECQVATFTRPGHAASRGSRAGAALLGLYERLDRRRSRQQGDLLDPVEAPPSSDAEPDPAEHDAFLWLSPAERPTPAPGELRYGVWYLLQGC